MADKTQRDMAFWIDSAVPTLTNISAQTNQASIQRAVDLLESEGLGNTERTFLPGLGGTKIPVNGFVNTTIDAILGPLISTNTSITKTAAYSPYSTRFYKGECWVGDVEFSGDRGSLQTWSATLTFEGAVTRTSVIGT